MLECRLAHGALEQEDLVGKLQRIAVVEIDLELGRAALVAQCVDVELLRLAEVVDVLDDGIEIIGGVDAIGLPARFLAARAADRRFQRIVGIDIALDQIEFELGCYDRPPALFLVEVEHAPQHMTRRDVDRIVIEVEGVADHLGGRLLVPGHEPNGVEIGLEVDVDGGIADGGGFPHIAAIDGQGENFFGDAQAPGLVAFQKLGRRQNLPPGRSGHIGHQTFHFTDPAFTDPFLEFRLRHDTL